MCHFLVRKALWMRKASLDIPKWTNKYAWKLLSPREPSLPLFLNCLLTFKNERVTVQLRVSASNFRPAAINWKRSSLPYTCKWSQKFSGGFLPWDTDPVLHLDGNVILVHVTVKPICTLLNPQLKLAFQVAITSIRRTREN